VVLALSSRFPTSAGEQCQKMRLDELRRISQHIQLKSPPSAPWQKVSSGIDAEVEKQNLAAVEVGTAAKLQELARERAEAERMHEEWMQESLARIERIKSRYDGIPSSHIIRGLPRNARALPFARLPHHLIFVVGLTPTSEGFPFSSARALCLQPNM